jgi:DNA-3-methyladenine glycosylase II
VTGAATVLALDKAARKIDIDAVLSAADPKLGRLIQAVVSRIGRQRITLSKASFFEALVRAIIYQSVSAKAAAVIYQRMQQSVKAPLTPNKVLALPRETIRAVGLSNAKANYVYSLAEWFNANRKIVKNLPNLSDEEVVTALIAIPGIGEWTANVFLIFSLGRLDVAPANDLGIRRGVQLVYGMKDIASPAAVQDKARRWQPYRSIASIYLWQVVRLNLTRTDLR